MATITDVESPSSKPARMDRVPERPGILIVDDDPLLRMLLNLGLRQHGFRVWQAGGGREAVAVYPQYGALIDLVVLDVRMPDDDGTDTPAALQGGDRGVTVCFLGGGAGAAGPRA